MGVRQARHQVRDSGPVFARGERSAPAFDQHLLARALARELLGERLIGELRLAVPPSPGLSVTIPAAPPIRNATTTNASHPITASCGEPRSSSPRER